MSDLILYTTEDGKTRLDLRDDGTTIWLSQLEIAELFQTTKQNVSLHAKNIFAEQELNEASVVKESLTTQNEGNRQVNRGSGREGSQRMHGQCYSEIGRRWRRTLKPRVEPLRRNPR